MISKVHAAVIRGIEAVPVTIETDIERGMPNLMITGLADATVKEAAVRVRAAISNSGMSFPRGRISINIAPAEMRKKGSVLDLGLAVGILGASGQIITSELDNYLFAGELSLDGTVCPSPGILNITEEAVKNGLRPVVPYQNINEAALVRCDGIYPVSCINEIADHFNRRVLIDPVPAEPLSAAAPMVDIQDRLDFSDVKGQENAKRALMIAAAGGHGVLMTGSPSTGKTMLAERVPGIMPPMSYEEIIRATEIYSAAGRLSEKLPFITERPFRRPHHSVTEAGLIGGGGYPKPGEVTLASGGILFLDEFAEIEPRVTDALREPLERKEVVLVRGGESYSFPADFLLIAASNPCRCGYYGDPDHECICTPGEIARYRQKISGPVLDRIDIHLALRGVAYSDLHEKGGMTTEEMREKVIIARETQRKRFEGTGAGLNSQMSDRMVSELTDIDEEGQSMLRDAYDSLKLSPRTLSRTMKVARTIADINENIHVGKEEVMEALQYSRYRI